MTSEGATEEILRHQHADLLEFVLQQLCQSCRDLDVYLASPDDGCPGTTLAPLLNQPWAQQWPSECRRTLAGPPAASAAHWAPEARLAPPTAPGAWLFCAVAAVAAGEEECPSSFVIEAMGELDVLGTVTWRISLSGIQISESESCGKI